MHVGLESDTPSEPAVALGDQRPPRHGCRRRSCRSRPRGGCGRCPRRGTAARRSTATDAPSRAARSTSVSRAVSGDSPATRLSVARAGSTTRRPACTRRTASASWRAGVSFTTKPDGAGLQGAPQEPGPAERRHDEHPHVRELRASRAAVASMPSSPGISTSSSATSGRCSRTAATTASPRADLGDDLEVRLEAEQRGERAADERLVVGQQQPDHGRDRPTARSRGLERPVVTTVAPAAAARSRSPAQPVARRPWRRRGPPPSSATSTLVGVEPDRAGARAAVPDHVGDALADGPGEQLAQRRRARRRRSWAGRLDLGGLERGPGAGELAGQA